MFGSDKLKSAAEDVKKAAAAQRVRERGMELGGPAESIEVADYDLPRDVNKAAHKAEEYVKEHAEEIREEAREHARHRSGEDLDA